MMSIRMLPLEVSQKIKAGEVVEDPSSVVRELLDNSIDALATEIDIEIQGAGFNLIKIKDNGNGMVKEDLEICFLEHTTSKINQFEDIFALETRGFRGEALASICKVAHVSISSGHKDAQINHSITIHNNTVVDEQQLAYKQGTTTTIENLFYNMPVRKQFLKSAIKEINKIKKEVLLKALAFPFIRFTLKVDSKDVAIVYPSYNSFQDRITGALPILNPLHHFYFDSPDFTIEGFITGLNQTFDHASYLYIFVNNHPMSSKSFYGVIKKALSGLIPNNKHLGGAIYIRTDPSQIDPNIHPAKKEIKLFNEQPILSKLYHSIIDTLRDKPYEKELSSPDFNLTLDFKPRSTPSIDTDSEKIDPSPSHMDASFLSTNGNKDSNGNVAQNLSPHLPPQPQTPPTTNEQFNLSQEILFNPHTGYKVSPGLYLGTLFGTYWLYEIKDTLYFIDFHAAHERQRYEMLKKSYQSKKVESQRLLMPEVLALTPQETIKFEKSCDILTDMGFDANLIGDNVLSVSSHPAIYKKNQDWKEDLHHFLLEEVLDDPFFPIKDYFLKRVACRYSYMSQDIITEDERTLLCKQIFEHAFPHTCPHGRPFLYTMKKQSIESQFLR